jgi:hypothetical protein
VPRRPKIIHRSFFRRVRGLHTPAACLQRHSAHTAVAAVSRGSIYICLHSSGWGFVLSASIPNSCSGAGITPALRSGASSAHTHARQGRV